MLLLLLLASGAPAPVVVVPITADVQVRVTKPAEAVAVSYELTESGEYELRDTADFAPLRPGVGKRATRMASNSIAAESFELRG